MTGSFLVTGYDGAGKSTVAGLLRSHTSMPIVECGTIVKRMLAEHGAHGVDSCSGFMCLKSIYGSDFLAEHIRQVVRGGPAIFVGVRDKETFDGVEAAFATTLFVHCSPALRSDRLLSRDGARVHLRPPLSERDSLHRSWGLDELRERSHGLIDNSVSLDDLHRCITRIVYTVTTTKMHNEHV